MKRNSLKRFLAIAGGVGVLGWPLVFPFYGPLAYSLLQDQAALGTHGFALGLALGFLLAAMPRQKLRLAAGPSAVVGVLLVILSVLSPFPYVTASLMLLGGIATASPTLAWTSYLAQTEKRVFPFTVGVIVANLLCYGTVLAGGGSGWNYALVTLAALIFIAVAFALEKESGPEDIQSSSSWPLLWPLLVFIVASSYVGGLLYGAILPALEGWHGIGWFSYWPYIIAFALAGFIASRSYEILPMVTLSVYGLALLPLAFSDVTTTVQLSSFTGTMIGAAFADAFIWLALIYLASRGYPRVVAWGLGLNVFLIWAVSVTSDLAVLHAPERIPLASMAGAALLFVLIPIIVPRLAPSPAPSLQAADDSPNHTQMAELMLQDLPTPLTEAEQKVGKLLLLGKKNQEIATDLFITVNTVKYHVRNVLRKSGCSNRKELIDRVTGKNNEENTSLPVRSLES